MNTELPASPSANRHIALLIDADNISHTRIAAMLAELSKYGTANIRRAYGDWASASLKGWKDKLHTFAIRPIQQFSYSTGKNATDIALVIDAMELLYTQDLDGFCIASSDADFTPLVMQLKANGHEVYGFGERKTPDPFVNACTTFLFVDSLGTPETPSSLSSPSSHEVQAKELSKPAAGTKLAGSLARDVNLITILRGGVEAASREDGWAFLSTAGSAAKRQAPIDPRNYGKKNFRALFEAVELFDIVKVDGQFYIAEKGNADRAPQPAVN